MVVLRAQEVSKSLRITTAQLAWAAPEHGTLLATGISAKHIVVISEEPDTGAQKLLSLQRKASIWCQGAIQHFAFAPYSYGLRLAVASDTGVR